MNRQVIYVPTLHPLMAPATIPGDVLFVCPNLPLPHTQSERLFVPANLPFAPQEAAAVLREMISLGLSFGQQGSLKLMAGQERMEAPQRHARADENAALAAFAKSGDFSAGLSPSAAPSNLEEQLKNAHKVLLLAWEHENYIADINELEQKISSGNRKLWAAFNGEEACGAEPDEDAVNTLARLAAADSDSIAAPEYSWRMVLEAMAPFLPQESILLSAHSAVHDDMQAQGLLRPLPGNISASLAHWPQGFTSGLLWARLPLWQALGQARPLQEKPWLENVYDIIVTAPRP